VVALLIVPVLAGGVHAAAAQPVADPDARLRLKWERIFRAADQDGSRSLTRAEAKNGLPKVLLRRFDAIDLDADGAITPEELWAMHEREVAERERRRRRGGKPPR
jgi:hypothetical protein